MRRTILMIAVFAMLAAACGDDDDAATTVATTGSSTTTTTAAPPGSTAAPTTTAAPAETTTSTMPAPSGGGQTEDCLDLWPEAAVQALIGPGFTFFEANLDRSSCAFTAIPNSFIVSYRDGDAAALAASRTGASATGAVTDINLCAAAFQVDTAPISIIEVYDGAGTIYNVTSVGVDDPVTAAGALIGPLCS